MLRHVFSIPDHSVARMRHGRPGVDFVRIHGAADEVLARIDNFEIGKAAFEKALFVYPQDHLEMRQGARIILNSKED
jgi:hypothetical protein